MSLAIGDPLPTQGYTSLPPRTEDPDAQKIQSRQTLKKSLVGKGNQHLQTCFLHPVSGGRGNCSVSTLSRCAGASEMIQDPPSSPEEEHRAHWGGMQHLLHLHGQGTLFPQSPTTPSGLSGCKAATPWEAWPPLHFQAPLLPVP